MQYLKKRLLKLTITKMGEGISKDDMLFFMFYIIGMSDMHKAYIYK